jgi:Tol biopolymer transport system component
MRRAGVCAAAAALAAFVLMVGACAEAGPDTAAEPSELCVQSDAAPTGDSMPDRTIAFTSDRSGSFDVWLMGSDGSAPIQLTTAPQDEVMPSWSPDGERVAFVSARDALAADSRNPGDICLVNADGTGLTNLTDTADVYETTPSWSPDGSQIAFGVWSETGNEINVMDSEGGDRRALVPSDANWPSWSPDGERLVFSSSRGSSHEQLWTVGRGGDNPVQLTDAERAMAEPAWSPDGRSIAFSSPSGSPEAADPAKWNEDIFVMPADGGPGRRVTTLPGNDHWPPSWSPDGRQLVFTADGEEQAGEITVVDLGTLETTNLTNNKANDAFPAWRPGSGL